MQLTICQAQGVKIGGRKPKLDDFLPDYAKPKANKRTPEQAEARLKAAFASLAKSKKPNG